MIRPLSCPRRRGLGCGSPSLSLLSAAIVNGQQSRWHDHQWKSYLVIDARPEAAADVAAVACILKNETAKLLLYAADAGVRSSRGVYLLLSLATLERRGSRLGSIRACASLLELATQLLDETL